MIDFEKQTEKTAGELSLENFSLPEAFLTRMQELLAKDEYAAFLSSYGQKRRYSLRINPLKADREKALQLLRQSACAAVGSLQSKTAGSIQTEGAGSMQSGEVRSPQSEADSIPYEEWLQPVPWEADGFYYPEEFRPGRLPWHEAGLYYIQEASAMAPAMLCGVKPGDRVLDLCAAPGGKSTKLAACLRGEGILVANEIHPERAKILSANLERMGVRNAMVTNETPRKLASRFPLFFDKIVVDAPCSGEGMFRKEEEALFHWSPENVRMCAQRQTDILEEAASMLRPGGRLVYSTCTFSPEENEGVIFRFLMEHPEFSVVSIPDLPGIRAKEWGFACGRPQWLAAAGIDAASFRENGTETAEALKGTLRLWPHLLKGEGHFAAVLRKEGPQSAATASESETKEGGEDSVVSSKACIAENDRLRRKKEKKKGKGPKGPRGGKRSDGELSLQEVQRMWKEFYKENLLSSDAPDAVSGDDREKLCMFGSALFGLPLPASNLSIEGLRVLRAGLHLGTVNRGRFEPSHALAMALRREEVCRFIEFEGNSPEAYAWIRGESVSVGTEHEKGWTLVLIDGCGAGWGKVNGGILKNHYPKGLRKGSNYR